MPSGLRKVLAATGLLKPAFRLRERLRAMNAEPAPPTAPDGLPLPRPIEMVRVVSHHNWRLFYDSGLEHAAVFNAMANEAGVPLSAAQAVLDWGCGCGRITRHLPTFTKAQIIGRDPDPVTVGWSARNLPGDFRQSQYDPPLDLADASVDVVIGLSVFTHLGAARQAAWLAELARIIRPGGLLLLTFMDEIHHTVGHLGPAQADLDAKGFAVTTTALEGTNHMATFQTKDQLAASAAPWFRLAAARDSRQTSLAQAVLALVRI